MKIFSVWVSLFAAINGQKAFSEKGFSELDIVNQLEKANSDQVEKKDFSELGRKSVAEKEFENWIRKESEGSDNVLDLRVSKAIGTKGYYKMRVSVITEGDKKFDDFKFDYERPFKNRWTHAYDLGKEAVSCDKNSIFYEGTVIYDAECLMKCNQAKNCSYYTYFDYSRQCQLANSSCKLEKNKDATATYQNFGERILHSSIIDVKPGINKLKIGGIPVNLNIPKEDGDVSGIVWSDPCIASRWVNCLYSDFFNTFTRSHEMLNTLNEDPNLHFFQILGDNFYDQDSRLTKSIFDRFSLKTKSKIFQTVVGNHDIWVVGGPPGDRLYDQYGYGYMQYYAQDVLGGGDKDWFDFSLDPNKVTTYHHVNNPYRNFFWFHKLGNLGFIGYNGAATLNETDKDLEQACSYFEKTKPAFVFLLGHWNEADDSCDPKMSTPAVRKHISQYSGCDIGDRLKFIDGHQHCNYIQENGKNESIGYMIGGRGMVGTCLPTIGFLYLDSNVSKNKLTIYYFDEGLFRYKKILKCVQKHKTIAACTDLASIWLETSIH